MSVGGRRHATGRTPRGRLMGTYTHRDAPDSVGCGLLDLVIPVLVVWALLADGCPLVRADDGVDARGCDDT